MKINKILIGLTALVLCFASCKQQEETFYSSLFFLKKTDIGLYNEAKPLYTFNKANDQLYFNKTTNTFRIVSDDSNNYVEVVFAEPIPMQDAMLTASIKNGGLGDVADQSAVEFQVLKKDVNKCWLWNQKSGLGLIVFYVE